ncbi:copper amine oxidase N-terminal domain-containing protein [Paenibacillus senegalimassiliensis]|uniref:copper amine oxidase N-terminal domain-containing protein n=1 Tax=Paenibacillus senegalimassiliensis TaxID=1737426 RepID=UPI00073EC5BD|nr:copper amine oxidase N-terminal domain-containing protein [Paenibacillus senegalimassiliensis]
MLKKLGLVLISTIMLLGMALGSASAARTVYVQVDGKNVSFPDAKPYVESNRVLIPVRFVSESLGAKVDYKKETVGNRVSRTVYVTMGDKNISLEVNSNKVLVDGNIVTLDVPARVKQERVFVPLRFVSEALGATVEWKSSQSLVSISTGKEVTEPDPVPDDDNMYSAEFEWKAGYTELAKELFIDNMKVENGKLMFTMPAGANGSYGNTKLTAGKNYTFDIGEGTFYFTIAMVYPGRDEQEAYTVALDSSGNEDLKKLFSGTNDAIVIGNNGSASTLTEVLKMAKLLQ